MSSNADTIRRAIYANGPQKWDVPIAALDALLAENQQLRAVERAAREICDFWVGCAGEIDGDSEFSDLRAALAAVGEE